MKKIKLMNKIADVGTNIFNKNEYEVSDAVEAPDAMMVRSANLHEMEFNPELLAIARAGAGVNNIPVDECAKRGVVIEEGRLIDGAPTYAKILGVELPYADGEAFTEILRR